MGLNHLKIARNPSKPFEIKYRNTSPTRVSVTMFKYLPTKFPGGRVVGVVAGFGVVVGGGGVVVDFGVGGGGVITEGGGYKITTKNFRKLTLCNKHNI